jgi:hypothetical protein
MSNFDLSGFKRELYDEFLFLSTANAFSLRTRSAETGTEYAERRPLADGPKRTQ